MENPSRQIWATSVSRTALPRDSQRQSPEISSNPNLCNLSPRPKDCAIDSVSLPVCPVQLAHRHNGTIAQTRLSTQVEPSQHEEDLAVSFYNVDCPCHDRLRSPNLPRRSGSSDAPAALPVCHVSLWFLRDPTPGSAGVFTCYHRIVLVTLPGLGCKGIRDWLLSL